MGAAGRAVADAPVGGRGLDAARRCAHACGPARDIGTQAESPKTADQWLLRREVDRTQLDKANQLGRRAPLEARLESIGTRIKEQEAVVHRLEQSPYLRAVNGKVVLAFVPYSNLRHIKTGTKLYGCSWGLVMCSRVGKIKGTIDGEVQDIHPHDQSVQRGIMVEIELTTPSAEGNSVLFAGGSRDVCPGADSAEAPPR